MMMRAFEDPTDVTTRSAAPYLDYLYAQITAPSDEAPLIEIAASEPENAIGSFFDRIWSSAQEGIKQADHSITTADQNILMSAMVIVVVLIIVILTYRSS